jgi:hypothetical protein
LLRGARRRARSRRRGQVTVRVAGQQRAKR